jgi:zinc protease
MKSLTRSISLAFLACAVSAPISAQSAKVTKFTVAGIPVIFKPVRANDVIAVRMYLRGGSANLSARNAGIELMMLGLTTQGTQKYDKDAFTSKAVETGTAIGADGNYDYSVLTLQAVRQHWGTAWDLFTQAALKPTFPASEVELAKGQALNGLKQLQDDPDSYLTFLADSVFYASHPYSVRPGGTMTSVPGITRQMIVDWHRQRMTRENLLIVVVGNVSKADLTAKIASSFGKLPAKGGAAVAVSGVSPVKPDVLVVSRDLPTNYITGYFATPSPSSRDYAALRVATDVLSDRLFEEVRTKRNLTYAVAAGLESRAANRGRLYVTAVEPDTTMKVIFSEVRRLQNEPLPRETLSENVMVFLTNFWAGQQTNMGQAAQLGAFELLGGGWQNMERFVENVRRVTPADVQRVARAYMQHGTFVVLGDSSKINRGLFTSF